MTLYAFEVKIARKMLNMAAILKFKMAAEDTLEKKWKQLRFCSLEYKEDKKHCFH